MVGKRAIAASSDEDSDVVRPSRGLHKKRTGRVADSESEEVEDPCAPAPDFAPLAPDLPKKCAAPDRPQDEQDKAGSAAARCPADEANISVEELMAMRPPDGGAAGRRRSAPDWVGRTTRAAKEFLRAHRGDRQMDLRAARLAVLPKDVLARFAEQNKARARGAWVWDVVDTPPNHPEEGSAAANDGVKVDAKPVMFDQLAGLAMFQQPTSEACVSGARFGDTGSSIVKCTATTNQEVAGPASLLRDRPADHTHVPRRPHFRPLRPPTDDGAGTEAMRAGRSEKASVAELPFVIKESLPCRHTKRRKPDVLSRYHWTCELCGEVLLFDGWSQQYQASSNWSIARGDFQEIQGSTG